MSYVQRGDQPPARDGRRALDKGLILVAGAAGQFDDQRAEGFGQLCGDLLDELLLALNVNRRKELVFVDGLQQILVFLLALVLGIRERRDMTHLAVELQFVRASFGKFEQLLRGRHLAMVSDGETMLSRIGVALTTMSRVR